MKISLDSANYINKSQNTLAFKGYKVTKDDEGLRTGEFAYPFDPATTDCYLEIAIVDRDPKTGVFYLTGEKCDDLLENSQHGRKLHPGKNKINIHAEFGINEDEPFAYHYKLIDKSSGRLKEYGVDAGMLLDKRTDKTGNKDEAIYNLFVPASNVSRAGSMILAVPDTLAPQWIYDSDNDIIRNENADELKKNIRLFSNKIGGTLAGLEKKLEDGSLAPYERIVSLPLFTDDSRSHHAYWNKNCMQMAHSIGNINNYTSLTKKLFASGKSLVSDGAFVNEGLEGIHFHHALKWKEDSPFFNWFRMNADNQVLFGVFPQNTEILSHRIVNPKFHYKKDKDGNYIGIPNDKYQPTKPTYFEIFDKDLVNVENLNSQEPIENYNKNFWDKGLSKSSHNDTIVPYREKIDPNQYDLNVKALNKHNQKLSSKIDLYSGLGTKYVAKFSNFQLDDKIEGNIDTWGSNFDIAKIHYFVSTTDMDNILSNKPGFNQKEYLKNLTYAGNEAQDYVITSGAFWTRKTKDILNLHVAQNLKHIDKNNPKEAYRTIIHKANTGVFPEKIKKELSETAVVNVLNGTYNLKEQNTLEYKSQVAQAMMNVPLDSIELGDDISAVLATPYITKRSHKEEYIGTPKKFDPLTEEVKTYDRYYLNKIGNPHIQPKYEKVYNMTNKLFVGDTYNSTGPLSDFAIDIINRLNNDKERPTNQKIHDGDFNTEYGNYVVPILAEEILKFAIIKSLCPAPRFQTNDNGDISYDYNRLKKVTLDDIGVKGISPEDEAEQLIKRIKSGLKNISESDKEALADALKRKIKGTNAESFKLAEVIVDRAEAGLDWRIDAAKDVADVDSLRNNGESDFDTIFKNVTSFWDKFSRDILVENPNSLLIAELTDMNDLYDKYGAESQRYPEKSNLIGKFLNDSNLTTVANYEYFFSSLPEIFAINFNNGQESQNGNNYLDNKLFDLITNENTGFVRSAQAQSLAQSYTFLNNHDNTRALHMLAIDPVLFHGFENKWSHVDNKEEAVRLITGNYDNSIDKNSVNLNRYSSKDIAMVKTLRDGFFNVIDEDLKNNNINEDKAEFLKTGIKIALTEIANGKFKGDNYEKDTFGVRPIDMAINFTLDNAIYNGFDITENDYRKLSEKVFEKIMAPAYQKYNAMMQVLVALPGNPTLYSGDEYGSTGYEYETKNVTVQNRSYIHNEWADKSNPEKRNFIIKNNNNLKRIMHQRKRPELQALNDGAIFTLKQQEGKYKGNQTTYINTILRQNTAGNMTISLINVAGVVDMHKNTSEYKPNKVTLNEIDLSKPTVGSDNYLNVGLPSGLPLNTIFLDANKDNTDLNDIYVVQKNNNGKYCIQHKVKDTNGSYKTVPIEINDTTMILYHDPKHKVENISFRGKKFLYNPQYNNFGVGQNNVYTSISTPNIICGEKLSLVSR